MRFVLPLVIVLLVAAGCTAPPSEGGGEGEGEGEGEAGCVVDGPVVVNRPVVVNVEAGEVVHHNLLIVDGTATGDTITVSGADGPRAWPVVAGRFRALVPLAEGDNCIGLADDVATNGLPVTWSPDVNPRFVRTVYVDAVDGDGTFLAEAGEDNSAASAHARLSTTMWLLQAFVAENMHEEGFGRRTFRLELAADEDGVQRPVVTPFTSPMTMAEAHATDGNGLWSRLYGELETQPQRDDSIDVVVMAMTRYDPSTQAAVAHTALGGGRLGLFGSGTLHTYAPSLDDVVAFMGDERAMDETSIFDDSGGRDRHWAAYATGIGAMLHELGHCLSLPHPASGQSITIRRGHLAHPEKARSATKPKAAFSSSSIMSRGFDQVNRKLVLVEPASATSAALSPIPVDDEVGFDRSHAVRLGFHRWLTQNDELPVSSGVTITVDGDAVIVASDAGVAHIEVQLDGNSAAHDEFIDDVVTSSTLSVADLRARLGPGAVRVTAIDRAGVIAERDVP